jgi:hypothetical protein
MSALQPILLTALLAFLLVGSLLGIGVGAGLLLRNERVAAFLQLMNRWVSTRRVLRPVELPRELGAGHAGRGLGALLVLAGGYSLAVLAAVPVSRVASALRFDNAASPLAMIAIETAKWLLVAGCAVSVASGVLLLFFPRAWHGIEALANRWYSSRQITSGGDDMHLPLDRAAGAFPRAAGGLILVLSAVSSVACALLLLRL